MIKEYSSIIRKLELILDLIVLFFIPITFFILGNDFLEFGKIIELRKSIIYNNSFELILYSIFIFMVLYYLYFDKIYISQRYLAIGDLFRIISYAFVKSSLIIVAIYIFLGIHRENMNIFLIFLIYLIFLGYRIFLKVFLFKIRSGGFNFKQLLLVGAIPNTEKFCENIYSQHSGWGLRVLESLEDTQQNYDKYLNILRNKVVDEIVFFVYNDNEKHNYLDHFIQAAEEFGKTIRFVLNDEYVLNSSYNKLSFFGTRPTIYVRPLIYSFNYMYTKRIVEILIVISLIPLLYLKNFFSENKIELKQYLNVLFGKYSLIGIYTSKDIENFRGIKKGILGLGNITKKKNIDYKKLNMLYIHKWSLLLDLKILIMAVLKKKYK